MNNRLSAKLGLGFVLVLALSACNSGESPSAAASQDAAPASDAAAASAFPASLPVIGEGYPVSGAPCRRLGENEATVDWLDDSADLVGCPTKDNARELGGRIVGVIEGITLVSVPRDKANAGLAKASGETAEPKAVPRDPIRGKNGLEAKCKARVARDVGARVLGTNRIEEAQAAIDIYLNVEGAQAPWLCRGYRDGTIETVMFTGDEGAL